MFQNKLAVLAGSLLVLVAVVAVAGFGYYVVLHSTPPPQYSEEKSVFSVLTADNAAFKEADTLMRARDFQSAHAKYVEALSSASDSFQEAYVKYWIASMDESLGDYTAAIRGFKEVAGAPISYSLIRAYAVVRIGLLYDLYGYGENRGLIIAETFKGDPYTSFLAGGDEQLAYRRLYEYASSLFPVALSELHIADWHVDEILSLQLADVTADDEYLPHRTVAIEKLRSAETDIERSLQDQNASGFMPVTFVLMGEVLAKLTLISQRSAPQFNAEASRSKGISFEAAEDAYVQALKLRALQGEIDGYERFYYASFLERYYPKRVEDLKKVLSNFLTPPYQDAPIMEFFGTQRDSGTWMSGSLIGMAKADSEFKKLLVSLGWTEADFK